MNKEEAIKLIMSKFPDRDIDKITETGKYFLVSIMSKQKNQNGLIKTMSIDDGLKAVDKETKEVFTYNPIRHK